MDISTLSTTQLEKAQLAVDSFLFKETGKERWESSFTKNPEQFDKLISQLVLYKRDLMRYFRKQFDNRWNLVNQYVIRADEFDDEYFFPDQWGFDNQELAQILEKNNNVGFDFGAIALALAIGRSIDFTSADAGQTITKNSVEAAKGINDVTQRRIAKEIRTMIELNQSRSALEDRLKDIFINNVRGSMISENQTLTSYFEGKQSLAVNQDLGEKTWLGSQASDFICGSVNNETVRFDQPFSNGLMGPLAHIGCRCDVLYL